VIYLQGIILCGGYGTRMGHLTEKTPKSLLKLGNYTLLDYILKNIDREGVNKVYLAVGHLKDQIIDHVEQVKDNYRLKIDYISSSAAANTAGSVLQSKDIFSDDFFVTVGDDITNIDFRDFYDRHKESKAIASIAAIEYETKYDYGVLETKNNYVTGFKEKPINKFLTNTGIYFFKPQIFNHIEFGDGFARDVFPRLLKRNMKIYSYTSNFFWYSVGNLEQYNFYNKNLHLIEKYF